MHGIEEGSGQMKRLLLAVVTSALLLCSSGTMATGDSRLAPRGVIPVSLWDTAGRPLPGVTVTLRSTSDPAFQPQTRVTSPSGAVSFTHLPQGQYSFSCELSGFFVTTISDVPIEL